MKINTPPAPLATSSASQISAEQTEGVDPRGVPLEPSNAPLPPTTKMTSGLGPAVSHPSMLGVIRRHTTLASAGPILAAIAGAMLLFGVALDQDAHSQPFSRSAQVTTTQVSEASPPAAMQRQKTPDFVAASTNGHAAWFSTDWFVADATGTGRGDPENNLWAEGGPLHKYDLAMGAKLETTSSSQAYERQAPSTLALFPPSANPDRGGALLAGEVSERNFARAVPNFLSLALGDPNAKVEPSIAAVDFVKGEGKYVQIDLERGDRVVPMLGSRVLELTKNESSNSASTHQITIDGRALSTEEARGVYWGVVDSAGKPKGDGLLDWVVKVDWWGNCDPATLAGLLLEAPKYPVERNGVVFSPRDIEGLLTLVVSETKLETESVGRRYNAFSDFVRTRDGRLHSGEMIRGADYAVRHGEKMIDRHGRDYRHVTSWSAEQDVILTSYGGRETKIPGSQIVEAWSQFEQELSPVDLREGAAKMAKAGGGAADVNAFAKVYNRPFSKVESQTFSQAPSWAGGDPREAGYQAADKEWGELTIHFADKPRTYRYWVAYDSDSRVQDFGYYGRSSDESVPDFLWAPRDRNFVWPKTLTRNPHLDVNVIKELYEQSLRPPADNS